MAGSANFEDTTKPNQSPAAGGFDSERRSSGVSARWLLMQSIKKPSQAIQSLRRRWKSTTILIEYARFCRVHFYHNECIARMISISISISRML